MKYLVILNILLSINIFSQVLPYNDLFSPSDSNSYFFRLNSQYSVQSNSLSKTFVEKIQKNEYLSKSIKESNPFKKHFLALYEWLNELHAYFKPDSLFGMDNLGLHFCLNHRLFSTISTKNDLLRMLMFGNKPFAGKEISFDASKMYYLNFSTASMGVYKTLQNNPSFSMKALFDINLHLFNEVQYVSIPEGYIFTADDGTYIEASVKGLYQASKQYQPGLSFNTVLKLTIKPVALDFTFSSHQLGFVRLGKHSQYARIDTSLTFEGLDVQNIFSTPTLSNGLLQNDSLKKFYQSFIDSTVNYLRLPEIFRFSISKRWNHNTFAKTDVGCMYIFHSGLRIPEIHIGQHFVINNQLRFIFGSSFAGFSNFNPFIMANYQLQSKWNILAYFSNPLIFTIKNYPYHLSLQFAITKEL